MTRVLVVDDEHSIRNTLRIFLEEEGYAVDIAGNGIEALQVHSRQPADVLVTDILMPDCDGLELVQRIRKETPTIRIIAFSGGGRVDPNSYLKLVEKLGAERILAKPFDRLTLVQAVQELLEKPPPTTNVADSELRPTE